MSSEKKDLDLKQRNNPGAKQVHTNNIAIQIKKEHRDETQPTQKVHSRSKRKHRFFRPCSDFESVETADDRWLRQKLQTFEHSEEDSKACEQSGRVADEVKRQRLAGGHVVLNAAAAEVAFSLRVVPEEAPRRS